MNILCFKYIFTNDYDLEIVSILETAMLFFLPMCRFLEDINHAFMILSSLFFIHHYVYFKGHTISIFICVHICEYK